MSKLELFSLPPRRLDIKHAKHKQENAEGKTSSNARSNSQNEARLWSLKIQGHRGILRGGNAFHGAGFMVEAASFGSTTELNPGLLDC